MTMVAHEEGGAAARVLDLLQVGDLETLRQRSKMLSVKESADLLIPVIAALAAEDDGGTAHLEVQPAVGVALYQCLIRQRLAGPSMEAVIAQVMSGEYKKPRELDKSIPRSLEAIISRATRERPEERFPSLRHLGAALLPFASRSVRQAYAADFPQRGTSLEATLLRRLEQGEDLKLLAAALAVALPFVLATRQSAEKPESTASSAQAAVSAPSAPSVPSTPSEPAEPAERSPAAEPEQAAAVARDEPAAKQEPAQPAPEDARANAVPDTQAAMTSTYPVDVAVQPGNAWIMLDSKAAGRGRLRRELPRDGRPHALHVGAPGYVVQALHFKDAPPPGAIKLAKRAR